MRTHVRSAVAGCRPQKDAGARGSDIPAASRMTLKRKRAAAPAFTASSAPFAKSGGTGSTGKGPSGRRDNFVRSNNKVSCVFQQSEAVEWPTAGMFCL